MTIRWNGVAALIALAACAAAARAESVVFFSDFDGTLPEEVAPGLAERTGVQLFANLGPEGNRFGGSFLRSPTGNGVTLTLTSLPPHGSVALEFLFAAIDSLDGTGSFPSGDFFRITVDGVQVFRESFANATTSQVQSYAPPPGGELARRQDLGFSGPGSFYTDSAYNFALEPALRAIPHSATTMTIEFLMEGPGVQPLSDESWAVDNLRVVLDPAPVCDSIDFNGDGLFPDTQDISDFLTVFGGGACPTPAPGTCGDIDFNNDGLFPDTEDIGALIRVFGGGGCV